LLDRFGQHLERRVARLLDARLAAGIDRIPDLDVAVADIERRHPDHVRASFGVLGQDGYVGRGGRGRRGGGSGDPGVAVGGK
jgi:hypothetical protein